MEVDLCCFFGLLELFQFLRLLGIHYFTHRWRQVAHVFCVKTQVVAAGLALYSSHNISQLFQKVFAVVLKFINGYNSLSHFERDFKEKVELSERLILLVCGERG